MSGSHSSAVEGRPSDLGTLKTILRLKAYAGGLLLRIGLGAVALLVGAIVALLIPLQLRSLVDGPLADGDTGAVILIVVLVVILGLIEVGAIILRRIFAMRPSMKVETALRTALYAKLQRLPVAFHDGWPSGQLLSRMYSDISLIRRFLAFGIMQTVVNTFIILGGFVLLLTVNWMLALIFIVASIPIWIVGFQFHNRYRTVARLSQDQAGDLATSVEESVHGIRVLKAFGRGAHALREFAEQADELRQTELRKAKTVANVLVWLNGVPDMVFALSLLSGVALAALGQLTVGDVVAFFAIAAVLRGPVESVGGLLAMIFDTGAAVERYFEVLDAPETIANPETPRHIATPRGRLVFEDVHFHYPDAKDKERDLINGLDLVIEPGETMAIVGITGSGKTTMTALIPRLYDVTGGRILLDGVDIRDLPVEELREHIAVAFEDATLFSASVRENVLLGRPEGSQEDLEQALEIAQADFVSRLPDGAETPIGEEGSSLSGGQRQRLALARAVAARPHVLVLDDPLSALDVDTEARVEAGLRRVLSDTTAVVVAHRPSTVMLADRVALLDEGKIVAVGTHSELLRTSARYRFVISSLDAEEKSGPDGQRGAVA
jgi:ATP-binding cassette subfamily B protein